jgi:hypothetical protein
MISNRHRGTEFETVATFVASFKCGTKYSFLPYTPESDTNELGRGHRCFSQSRALKMSSSAKMADTSQGVVARVLTAESKICTHLSIVFGEAAIVVSSDTGPVVSGPVKRALVTECHNGDGPASLQQRVLGDRSTAWR